jgi:hypothetical protein
LLETGCLYKTDEVDSKTDFSRTTFGRSSVQQYDEKGLAVSKRVSKKIVVTDVFSEEILYSATRISDSGQSLYLQAPGKESNLTSEIFA